MGTQLGLLASKVNSALKSKTYDGFKKNLAGSECIRCPDLCAERHHIVVDRGNSEAKVVIIGEAPGENEDLEGRSFVGRAGKLLDEIMLSIGLDTNKDMLILNVVKCRPPKNRQPTPQEAENCFPFLQWQLDHVKPKVIVLLGATAARHFLKDHKKTNMRDLVGRFFNVPEYPNAQFLLLYHPAYLLRDPRKKKDMWKHIQVLKTYLEVDKK